VNWVNNHALTVFTPADIGRACFVIACTDPFFRL